MGETERHVSMERSNAKGRSSEQFNVLEKAEQGRTSWFSDIVDKVDELDVKKRIFISYASAHSTGKLRKFQVCDVFTR